MLSESGTSWPLRVALRLGVADRETEPTSKKMLLSMSVFSLSLIEATYFVKSKPKLLTSWTALFLMSENSRTN